MTSKLYSDDELLGNRKNIPVPSKQVVARTVKSYIDCENRDVILAFVQDCVFKYDHIKFPTYENDQAYDTLKNFELIA